MDNSKASNFGYRTAKKLSNRLVDGTPSTKPSISFSYGKLVYDDFCLLGLWERLRDRERQDTCHNTVQAIKYPGFRLKTCMEYIDGQNCFAISLCKGYTLVYIVAQKSKPVQSVASIIPLDQHKVPNQPVCRNCWNDFDHELYYNKEK